MAEAKQTKVVEAKAKQADAVEPTKRITFEDIKSNPAMQRSTEGGKIVAEESMPETDVIYWLTYKDGAWTIVAGFGVNGICYSESEPVKADPEAMTMMSYDNSTKLAHQNAVYTVNWMRGRVAREISLKLKRSASPEIRFHV